MVAWKNWFTSPVISAPRPTIRPRRGTTGRWRYIEALEDRNLMAGAPTQLVFTVQPSQTAAGTPMFPSIQVSVEDFLSQIVTTDTSNITLNISSTTVQGATFASGSTITVKAVGGVANFTNVTFSTIAQYTLTASAPNGLVTAIPSNTFNVTNAATKLAFIQQPVDITAGSLFSPSLSVQVQDANGNLVTTDRSNITLSLVGTAGTITGTTTIAAVNGVATFNGIALPKTGSFRLQARDATLSDGILTGATSNSFTVSAGAPASLFFAQQPASTPGSTVLPPLVVNVLDALGNVVASDSSLVTLSIASGPGGGTIAGTTSVNAVNGVATFTNVSFPIFGNYTIRATDGNLNVATSNAFAITGPPAKLAFQIQPGQTTIGHIIAPSVTVLIEDSGGNVVSNDNSAVTLSIAAGPGGGTMSGTTTVNAVNGIATFSDLSLSAVGTYTLAASDNALTVDTSTPFLVNGTASQLHFILQPGASAAGAPIPGSVTVQVQDSLGNVVIDDSSLVIITLNGTGGALTGTTSVSAVHGLATFTNLIPSSPGTFTLTAADGPLTGDTSDSFVVAPSASKVIIFQQPVAVAATSTMPPIIIQIKNDDDNIVTTNSSAVTLAIVSGPSNATLSGTTTINAVNGVATFSNLKFSTPGNYQLVAFDGSLATDTSIVFTVSGPPTKLVFLQQPVSTIVAGHTLSAFTVAVRDAGGNLVSTDTSTITLTGGLFINGTNGTATSITAPVINGIATFPVLAPQVAGTANKFTASDGALTAAVTNNFKVTADTSTAHLVLVSSPASSLVGKKLSSNIVINAVDQFNNIITTDSSTIVLSKISGLGNLSGTLSVKANKGVATFSNVIASQAGPYTLRATDAKFSNPSTVTNSTISFSTLITPAITTIPNPSLSSSYTYGKTFTISDTIKSLISTPVGFTNTATLVDASDNILASGTVTASGATKFTINNFTTGSFTGGVYSVRIKYAGDNNHTGGQSALFNLTIAPAATTTTIVPAPSTNLATGQTLTLATAVNTFVGATVARTGIVIVRDNGIPLPSGTLTLVSSAASISFVPTVGTHKYSFLYVGDTNYKSSLSPISTIKIT